MRSGASFYVYEHTRADTGAVFYVGKGKGGRAYEMRNRNSAHCSIVTELRAGGLDAVVRIVRDNMSEPCAYTLEKMLIARRRETSGEMVNVCDGNVGFYSPDTPSDGFSLASDKTIFAAIEKLNAGSNAYRKRNRKPQVHC